MPPAVLAGKPAISNCEPLCQAVYLRRLTSALNSILYHAVTSKCLRPGYRPVTGGNSGRYCLPRESVSGSAGCSLL